MAQTIKVWRPLEWPKHERYTLHQYLLHLVEKQGFRIVQVVPTLFKTVNGQYGDDFSSTSGAIEATIIVEEISVAPADTKAMTESAIAFLQSQGLLPS